MLARELDLIYLFHPQSLLDGTALSPRKAPVSVSLIDQPSAASITRGKRDSRASWKTSKYSSALISSNAAFFKSALNFAIMRKRKIREKELETTYCAKQRPNKYTEEG